MSHTGSTQNYPLVTITIFDVFVRSLHYGVCVLLFRYCKECILPYQSRDNAQCPICVRSFDPHDITRAVDLEHEMRQTQLPCQWCGQPVRN